MKRKIKIWALRITTTAVVSALTLIGTVLNPGLLYAKKTEMGHYTVYHHSDLDPALPLRLQAVDEILKESEIFDADFKFKICLNDGSYYPELMETVRGPAFGWGFFNLAVFRGTADYEKNRVELHGYQWNLEQLFVHELIHCLQQNEFGPWLNYSKWKWEGYPEYVARKNPDQVSLRQNIRRLEKAEVSDAKGWAVEFDDGTIAPRTYYRYWLMVQYCLEVKKMTYGDLLQDETDENEIWEEMMNWYERCTSSYI